MLWQVEHGTFQLTVLFQRVWIYGFNRDAQFNVVKALAVPVNFKLPV